MEKEKGAVMIEAAIVFPIVLLTVFALIYLGLFKLQEMAMLYQVQRVAHQGACKQDTDIPSKGVVLL